MISSRPAFYDRPKGVGNECLGGGRTKSSRDIG